MTDQVSPKGGFFSRVETDAEHAVVDLKDVLAAVEAWYARHFHRAAVDGRAPISAADKADLVKAVTEATPKE